MKRKLTGRQKDALRWLDELRAKYPANTYGFNPSRVGLAAICRRVLEQEGFVKIDRVLPHHFRYQITDAGREALAKAGG